MNKYYIKKQIIPFLGLVISIVLFSLVYIYGVMRTRNVSEVKPGQAKIEELESMHTKGSYSSQRFDSFTILSQNNSSVPFDIKGYFVDKTIYFFLPSNIDSKVNISFTTKENGTVKVNGKELKKIMDIDLNGNNYFEFNGDKYEIIPVYLCLPYISFDTMNSNYVFPDGGYVAAKGRMWDANSKEILTQLFQIRVRGNLTSLVPKLSYKIKTSNNFKLYGLNKSDQWTLLANFFDPSMVRNKLAYKMAGILDMDYIPQQQYVEMYLNGEYQGVYAFTTQIGIHSGNISLPDITQKSDGSFMVELDMRSAGLDDCFESLFNIPYVLKSPNYITQQQRKKIQESLTLFEKALLADDFTSDGICYREIVDLRSFADVYLINEIMGNLDASGPLSLFIYKNSDGKIAMGPIWDMDLSAGNNSSELFNKPEGVPLKDVHLFKRLFEDPYFCNLVKEEYIKLSLHEDELYDFLKNYTVSMKNAANNNFIATYIGVNSYSNVPADDPFISEVEAVSSWLHKKFDWININLDNLWLP